MHDFLRNCWPCSPVRIWLTFLPPFLLVFLLVPLLSALLLSWSWRRWWWWSSSSFISWFFLSQSFLLLLAYACYSTFTFHFLLSFILLLLVFLPSSCSGIYIHCWVGERIRLFIQVRWAIMAVFISYQIDRSLNHNKRCTIIFACMYYLYVVYVCL